MGSVSAVNLEQVINLYTLLTFVETGLLAGDGVRAALSSGFKRVYSIDINEEYCRNVQSSITDPRLTVFCGTSVSGILEIISDLSGNTFWWLDAHLPALYGNPQIDDEDMVFPLISELEVISSMRDCSGDVFLLDDVWFYKDMSEMVKGAKHVLDVELVPILKGMFPDHLVYFNASEQGYLLLFPENDGVPDGFCIGWDCV